MGKTISIRIYINKIENRITLEINTWYILKFSLLKLLGSTIIKIKKNENGENVPHLQVTEVILIPCNNANKSRVLYIFVRNKSFGQLLDISLENIIFKNIWFRIFIYWSMIYRSKSQSSRDRRQNKYHFSY